MQLTHAQQTANNDKMCRQSTTGRWLPCTPRGLTQYCLENQRRVTRGSLASAKTNLATVKSETKTLRKCSVGISAGHSSPSKIPTAQGLESLAVMASQSSLSRIAQLAATITTNVAKIDEILAANDIPSPSFDETAAANSIPDDATDARDLVLDAATELGDLLRDPLLSIFHHGAVCTFIYTIETHQS